MKLSVASSEFNDGTFPWIKPNKNVFASAFASTPRILSLTNTKSGLKDLNPERRNIICS